MVISIETAQNGFVIRDSADGGTNPIVVADFNQLVGILVQAFNVEVKQSDESGESADEVQAALTEETTEETTEEPKKKPAKK
tara:strand:+ start:3228 stop:3473 length:246 start_codon:yes stop_codon:yes gene_type:complete